jgi:hypothetical protein
LVAGRRGESKSIFIRRLRRLRRLKEQKWLRLPKAALRVKEKYQIKARSCLTKIKSA